jgi:hypothetical protein
MISDFHAEMPVGYIRETGISFFVREMFKARDGSCRHALSSS